MFGSVSFVCVSFLGLKDSYKPWYQRPSIYVVDNIEFTRISGIYLVKVNFVYDLLLCTDAWFCNR